MSRLSDILCDYDPQLQEPLARLWEAASLVLIVLAVWEVVRQLAIRLVEESSVLSHMKNSVKLQVAEYF